MRLDLYKQKQNTMLKVVKRQIKPCIYKQTSKSQDTAVPHEQIEKSQGFSKQILDYRCNGGKKKWIFAISNKQKACEKKLMLR